LGTEKGRRKKKKRGIICSQEEDGETKRKGEECRWKKYTPTGPAAGVAAEVVTLICAYWPMLIIV